MYSSYLLLQTKFGKKKLVAGRLSKFPQITLIDEVYGRYDLVIRVDAEEPRAMEEFLQNNINTIEDIQRAESLVVVDNGALEHDEDEDLEG
ncbi:MAG: Lrp/AsnC ligand binding domain-containing protein [Nanoarchaeota archaeon]|nr:Lrp/AsnC ligand binding domain-containing protein [Nanoarchaeota archaeon]